MTYSGGTNLLNYSSNAFGAGWTLQGLEQITSESGRRDPRPGRQRPIALVYQQRRQRRRHVHRPAGEFSTLVEELRRQATRAR